MSIITQATVLRRVFKIMLRLFGSLRFPTLPAGIQHIDDSGSARFLTELDDQEPPSDACPVRNLLFLSCKATASRCLLNCVY